ncbi:DUF4283 domain-containing protein, partial [Alkalihalophilus pseudofirmus]
LVKADGCPDIGVRFLGGLFVLLEFNDEAGANDFILNSKDIWENWFTSLVKWQKDFTVKERLASILIHGVPPHAWTEDSFNAIGKVFGEVVSP